MKILIVSFDKNLVDSLEALFTDHDVFTAKNAEEALTLSPPDIDVIIFDAISGAILEEEINQLYQKKFKNQKYVILYDELFPIDTNNIYPPNKVLISRDAVPQEIVNKALGVSTSENREEIIDSLQETQKSAKEPSQISKETEKGNNPLVLIVSFDKKLTDSLENALSSKYRVQVVKNVKAAKEKGAEADIIVYDAISGSIAEKNLVELSEIPEIREKVFLILLDELFPIDIERINLPFKAVINRDAPIDLIGDEIDRLAQQKVKETHQTKETISETPSKSEEESIIEEALSPSEEFVLESTKEEKKDVSSERLASTPREDIKPIVESISEKLTDEKFVKMIVAEAISKELQGLREEIRMEAKDYIKDVIESVIREEIERFLLELKIADIIREETRKTVERKISELLK